MSDSSGKTDPPTPPIPSQAGVDQTSAHAAYRGAVASASAATGALLELQMQA